MRSSTRTGISRCPCCVELLCKAQLSNSLDDTCLARLENKYLSTSIGYVLTVSRKAGTVWCRSLPSRLCHFLLIESGRPRDANPGCSPAKIFDGERSVSFCRIGKSQTGLDRRRRMRLSQERVLLVWRFV